MERQSLLTKTKSLLSNVPPKGWIIGGVVFAVAVSYSLLFFIPKQIEFSYAEKSCAGQFVIAPDTQKLSSSEFTTTFENTVQIGTATLFATKVCVEPAKTPEAGTYVGTLAPFGGVIASTQLKVVVPEAPVARASDIIGRTISTAQPLKIQLTSADVVHEYSLAIAGEETQCAQASAELSCDVAPLDLKHGTEYTAALYQTYKEADKKILEGEVETLAPLGLSKASVKNNQTIYTAPTSFSFTFDQKVTNAEISLVKVVDDSTEPVSLTKSTTDATATIQFEKLDRESTYRLEITQAIGDNGSSLAKPITMNIKTSGGPKVKSVSIGSHSVSRSARILVTLDQPIDKSVDVAKFARVEGVSATVQKQSDTQISFTIRGGDCSAFKLIVAKGMKSGSNGESAKNTWSHSARTVCGTSWSIGRSVQGRSIIAYSFGSGSKTILFTGGMHGSEPSGYSTMMAWVRYLQAYAGDTIPSGKRVVIVPNTNPDGIAVGSRNNSRNVNIDRNFPTANWRASIETASGTLPKGGGKSAGSEPETAALMTLTRQLRPRLEVSFHAQGSLVGANKYADSVKIGNTYATTVGYGTMFYNAEDVMGGFEMSGEYEDWMGEAMGIPAILIELPTPSGNYLSTQLAALKKMLAV